MRNGFLDWESEKAAHKIAELIQRDTTRSVESHRRQLYRARSKLTKRIIYLLHKAGWGQ